MTGLRQALIGARVAGCHATASKLGQTPDRLPAVPCRAPLLALPARPAVGRRAVTIDQYRMKFASLGRGLACRIVCRIGNVEVLESIVSAPAETDDATHEPLPCRFSGHRSRGIPHPGDRRAGAGPATSNRNAGGVRSLAPGRRTPDGRHLARRSAGTIYDADGKILRAPVSTGQIGYETPAGIYSVIQKEAEHYSNLYDDASMPFMQRITWSGIALHAGALPGYPASHGCIRMPYGFAEQLFDLTKMGMRVVIVREDISPVVISHPTLFKSGPIRSNAVLTDQVSDPPPGIRELQSMRLRAPPADAGTGRAPSWRSIAATRATAADTAAKKTEEARRAAIQAGADAARVARALRIAESVRLRAEAQIRDVARMPIPIVPAQWLGT
jgi:L,D-transpeptidase-like protein